MSASFLYRRRIQFAETDMAGIVHFSRYFRFMEEAEHALWRAAGLSIRRSRRMAGRASRRPSTTRVRCASRTSSSSSVRIIAVSRRTIRYGFELRRDDTFVGHGSITVASVTVSAAGEMTSVDVPIGIVERLRGAMNGPPVEE